MLKKGRKRGRFKPSIDKLVGDSPCYKEGVDIAKYVRTLEAEFKELDVERKYWKRLLLSKLPAKIKEHIVEIIEGEHCTYDKLKKA